MILLAIACSAPGDATGSLVDARTGAAVSGAEIEFVSEASAPCVRFIATTDAAGLFRVDHLCAGESYAVRPADPTWVMPNGTTISGGSKGQTVALQAWRVPTSEGLWILEGQTLTRLPTNTALDRARGADGAEVRFPTEIPGAPPSITADRILVLAGAAVADWNILPLLPSERRTFVDRPLPVDPWVYVGVRFVSDTEAEAVRVTPTGVKEFTARQTRYFTAGAVPPGSYVVAAPESYRALIVSF